MARPYNQLTRPVFVRADPNIAKNPPKQLGPHDALEEASAIYGRLLWENAFIADNAKQFGKVAADSADKEAEKLVEDLADVIARGALIQDLTGRQEMLDQAGKKAQPVRARKVDFGGLSQSEADFVTIPFDAAAQDILARTTLPAETIDDILDAYEDYKFAIQADISREIANMVKVKTAALIRDGGTPQDFVEFAQSLGDGVISDNYAKTFFRTESTGAHAAGRIAQANSPELNDFIVAYKYVAVGDGDTRPNHDANDGLFFDKNDPRWAGRIPPNGFNCRCRLLTISKPRAKKMGRWDEDKQKFKSDDPPAAGKPDPGFENSPLTRIYGAGAQ